MEISMDWTPLLTISWPIHKGLPLAVFPSPKLHESAPEAFARRNNGTARGCRTEGKQLENFPSFQQNWLKNDTHIYISKHFITWIFPEIGKFIHVWGEFQDFLQKPKPCWTEKHNSGIISHHFPPPQTWRIAKFDQIVCWRIFQSNLHTLRTKTGWYSMYIYIYMYVPWEPTTFIFRLWPIYLGPKTFIFHGFGVQRYTVMYMWYWHLFGMTNTFWFRKLHSKKPTTYLHGKRKNHLNKSALEGDTLVPGRVIELEIIPSRELTYLPKNGILKMIFLFPRWDMLIPWRVCHWTGNHSSFLGGRKHFPITSHQLSVETLE